MAKRKDKTQETPFDEDKTIEGQESQTDDEPSKEEDSIPPELLDAIPEEDRPTVTKMFSMVGRMRPNPISSKLTSRHIDKILDYSENQEIRESKEKSNQRRFKISILIIGILFACFLIYLFKDDKEVLFPLITGILGFLGGIGVGRNI